MKLSLQNLNKLLNQGTGKDVDLAIHLAQFQDDDGLVYGVHYKIISTMLKISRSTFYKSLKRLEDYGIIEIDWRNDTAGGGWGWWSLKFLNNDYSSKDFKDKPYLNVNHEVLHKPEFYSLPLSAKKIVLHVMRIMNFRAREENQNIFLRLETLMRWTGISKRSVLHALEKLSVLADVFTLNLDGNDIKIPTGWGFNLPSRRSCQEADTKATHAIHYALNKIKHDITSIASYQSIVDVCSLLRRYAVEGFQIVSSLVIQSIKENGLLSARHVHHLIKKAREQERDKAKPASHTPPPSAQRVTQ